MPSFSASASSPASSETSSGSGAFEGDEQLVASLPMQLGVEVLRAELREHAAEGRVCTHAGERAPLELVAHLDESRRHRVRPRSRCLPPRRAAER